jgi:hypothetical protein
VAFNAGGRQKISDISGSLSRQVLGKITLQITRLKSNGLVVVINYSNLILSDKMYQIGK